jgi:putative colanic acid biosynthesis UDP-glucose lipid carrier transferase
MDSFIEKAYDPSKVNVGRRGDWLAEQSSVMAVIYVIVDLVAVILAAVCSHLIAVGFVGIGTPSRTAILVAVLLTWIVFNAGGLYESWRGRGYSDSIRTATICWLAVIVLLILSAYVIGVSALFDRTWVILWAALGLGAILSIRVSVMAILRAMRKRGLNHKRIVVIGGGNWGSQVIRRVHGAEWIGMDVVCVLDHNRELHGNTIDGVPVRGGYDLLLDVISESSIDEVWICLPLGSHRSEGADYIGSIMEKLGNSTVTQRLLPEFEEMRILNRPVTEIIGLPVVNLNTSPMYGINRIVKGVEDRLLALLILILVSPVLVVIALAIKLDSKGPVFLRQMRHGWDGKPFTVLKFRTMNGHKGQRGTVIQATRRDPRVTKVGRFLRENSLDELPQFLNVLQGKMSIVGPRPHAIEHNEYYKKQIKSYMQRHRVKPGITGWAQVNGFRGETADIEIMRKRVSLDFFYIDNWSLWLDLKIIALTLVRGFRDANAY